MCCRWWQSGLRKTTSTSTNIPTHGFPGESGPPALLSEALRYGKDVHLRAF